MRLAIPGASLLAAVIVSSSLSAQVSVPMSQYDLNRTGTNKQETVLSPLNVNATQFGKLFTRQVDDSVYGLPLIVSNVNVPDVGVRNILYVATMSNTVYAFDADDATRPTPYWSRNLGTAAATDPWIGPVHFGILGTPFIDVPTGTLYVAAKIQNGTDVGLWIHALDITTGALKYNSPQRMSFPFAGGPVMTNVPTVIQRAGLLVRNDILYIAVANVRTDPNDYEGQEGFLQSFNARDLSQRLGSFQVTPTGFKGGMWEAGRGLASDTAGNIYASTAGGTYDGVTNFGSSAMKFAPSTLNVLDWFTPSNYDYLFINNIDLAAGGITLNPNTNFAIAGGKEGVVYLLDTASMGKLENTQGQAVQRFQATVGCGLTDCAQFLGTAYWDRGTDGMLYVWDRGDNLRSYHFANQRFDTTPTAISSVLPAMNGGPAVSANGSDPTSGIVWAVTVPSNANETLTPGTLRAFRATNVADQLYNSDVNASRDALGNFTKFAPPVIANGKVYVGTQSNTVVVYGLLPTQPSTFLPIRVNAGGGTYVDPSGQTWSADTGFINGSTYVNGNAITNTTTAPLYQSERWAGSTLQYRFAVPSGTYTIRLKFSEIYFGSAGQRVFNIALNGQTVESNFDIASAAGGPNIALDRTYSVTTTNGQIAIDLIPVLSNPKISAIEILQTATVPPPATFSPIRINAGGPLYTDSSGQTWSADIGFINGSQYANGNAIGNTSSPALYQSERWAGTTLQYRFAVPNGTYTVRLKFAEIYFSSSGQRIFDVALNGQTVESNFDPAAAAGGPNIAIDRTYVVNVTTGQIAIDLIPVVSNPKISAIEILQGGSSPPPPAFSPIRVNAGGSAYVDASGQTWSADTAYLNGGAYGNTNAIANTTTPTLYQTERYAIGTLSYRFSAPAGMYNVRLKFAEIYYSGSGGERVFNVVVNGQTVESNFDVAAAAGGPNRAIDRTYAITASDGRIGIDLVPVVSNPKISAIEIVQQ